MTEEWGEGKTFHIDSLPKPERDKLVAGTTLIGRTGAKSIQIRYSGPPDDEAPTVWMCVAEYIHKDDKRPIYECAAAMHPVTAVMRLCEQLIDGGLCRHCNKQTIFSPDPDDMGFNEIGCVYAYDPGAKKFIRGCE